MAESADATDLKSVDGDIVRVRPPLAPQQPFPITNEGTPPLAPQQPFPITNEGTPLIPGNWFYFRELALNGEISTIRSEQNPGFKNQNPGCGGPLSRELVFISGNLL